ncbi:unnamed protein product [Ophioblennius macclurei]
MFSSRKSREEVPPVQQQLKAEVKTSPKEPVSLQKSSSLQNLTPMETPWENVTLNRCLFVAITILVLTSGFQRLNEALRGHRAMEEEEEVRLTTRHRGSIRHRGQTLEPDISLWDVMFWWLPDFDDEDEDEADEEDDEGDEDEEVKRRKVKQSREARASSSLRNKPLPDQKLMKRREGSLKERRAKKDRKEEEPEEEEEEAEEEEGMASRKNKKERKERKTQKG